MTRVTYVSKGTSSIASVCIRMTDTVTSEESCSIGGDVSSAIATEGSLVFKYGITIKAGIKIIMLNRPMIKKVDVFLQELEIGRASCRKEWGAGKVANG